MELELGDQAVSEVDLEAPRPWLPRRLRPGPGASGKRRLFSAPRPRPRRRLDAEDEALAA